MILTFRIKHGTDFSKELALARKVAEIAIVTRSRSTADVRHIGLKSAISNQILRKYSRKSIMKVKSVPLTVPGQSIKVNKESRCIVIPCLGLSLNYEFRNDFEKVNQIEIDSEYACVSVSIAEPPQINVWGAIGVDRNTTKHCVVIACPRTGKVWKLGKSAEHIHKKYSRLRRRYQRLRKYKKLKQVSRRERDIVKNIDHRISKKIVEIAKENSCMIRMENLTGIRKNKGHSRSFRYSLNSWSFYQQQTFADYKARLQGVQVSYDEPALTSQLCSRCGLIGIRSGKEFKCPSCGHVDHADSNASFNIALCRGAGRLHADRDACNGSTDTPREAIARMTPTSEPHAP